MQGWIKKGIWIIGILSFLSYCTPQTAQNATGSSNASNQNSPKKELFYEDYIYEDRIKTVQFYPSGSNPTDVMSPPVINIAQYAPLILEFDDLGKEYCNYYAKLYHCNFNWQRSSYTDLQFVSDINETMIQNYTTSINTKVRYSHYSYTIPRVKISGNYLLIVYRNGNMDDVVITRRFVTYSPLVQVNDSVMAAIKVQDRNSRQQVDCIVTYGLYEIPNPQDVRVVLRQNFRWDNAIVLTEPQYIQFDKKSLDYSFFDSRNTFGGGNEFRYFDIRNLRAKGMNVSTYANTDTTNTITLVSDKQRNSQTYSEQIDINGKYVIQRLEATDDRIEADYANVLFTLNVPPDFQGDVYVGGQLTDWQLRAPYKMSYNQEKGAYELVLLLKQGFYNYQYCLVANQKADWAYFEGNYSATENFYDIIVYYRLPNQFNDIVIGYASVDYRGRN
jgi:hypothetical protein